MTMEEKKKMRPASLDFMGRRDPATCGIWRNTTICPVTKNLPTRMLETAFRQMCARLRLPDRPVCLKCKGKTIPVGLEFIDLENELKKENDMGTVKSWYDTCHLCGEKKTVRKVKDHPCCPTCEHIFRAAHSSPDRLVDALKAAQGDEYAQKFAPVAVDDGPLSLVAMVGQIREKHNLAGDADVLPFVDNLVAEVTAKGEDVINIQRRLHAAEEVIENVRIMLGGGNTDESILEVAKRAMTCDGCDERAQLQEIRGLCDVDDSLPIAGVFGALLSDFRNYKETLDGIRKLLLMDEFCDPLARIELLKSSWDLLYENKCRALKLLGVDAQDDLLLEIERIMSELTSLRGMKDDVLNGELEKPWLGRESALLDLALDALAGNISGLNAERIAALR